MKTTRTTQMIKIKGIPENKILIIRFDFTALLKIMNLNLFYGLNRYFFPMLKYEKIDLLGILSVHQPLNEDKTYCPHLKNKVKINYLEMTLLLECAIIISQ